MDNPTKLTGKASRNGNAGRIEAGIPSLDGQRYFLSSADYPYFRDDPANWADRLEKLKAMGCRVVTFYIPWRHHDLVIGDKRELDFTGRTQPNRDVVGFIDLVHSLGLKAIVKPGPFVHAELNYGGLPDFVCPLANPAIEPMLGGDGQPFMWGGDELVAEGGLTGDRPTPSGFGLKPWPLPAPLDPVFQMEVRGWFEALREQVLKPRGYPKGPIIMAQLGNEGIFSNHQRAPWAYDYSRSGLEAFHRFLRERYTSLEAYNHSHGTACTGWDEIQPPRGPGRPESLQDSRRFADWAGFQAVYMGEIYAFLGDTLGLSLPYVLNVNPPTRDDFGADAWLSRVNPDVWHGVHYGFTNWIGVACDDEDVVDRYQLMVKRARGFNLEENWGFSQLYEPAFGFEAVSFYQTFLALASGGTGYNIYTGVGTDQAGEAMDRLTRGEYPDCAPVSAGGGLSPKTAIVARMNAFFNRWGEDFLQTEPVRPVAWGLYLPYAHAAVWVKDADRESDRLLGLPDCGRSALAFFRQMRRLQVDVGLVNLQSDGVEALQSAGCLALEAGRWMDRGTQERLREFVEQGGKLILFGSGPELDENFEPYNALKGMKERIARLPVAALGAADGEAVIRRAGVDRALVAQNEAAAQSSAWLYAHPVRDIQYLFVLAGQHQNAPAEWLYRTGGSEHRVAIRLPGSGAGVVRIEEGRFSAGLLKGWSDYRNERIAPSVSVDGETWNAREPGDWLVLGA